MKNIPPGFHWFYFCLFLAVLIKKQNNAAVCTVKKLMQARNEIPATLTKAALFFCAMMWPKNVSRTNESLSVAIEYLFIFCPCAWGKVHPPPPTHAQISILYKDNFAIWMTTLYIVITYNLKLVSDPWEGFLSNLTFKLKNW